MRTITQSEFTGVSYRLTDEIENIYEIYDEIQAKKKGWVYLLMKKQKYGIQAYCPGSKELGKWTAYNNLGMAMWDFDKLKEKVLPLIHPILPFILF